jgi:integrase/recombinase XerC
MEKAVISARSGLGLRPAADLYLLERYELSPRTIATYRWWLDKFIRYAGDRPLDQLLVRRFFADLKSDGHKLAYRHQAFRTLRTFFKWAVKAKVFPAYYMPDDFTVPKPKTLPTCPTDEEIAAIVKACPRSFAGQRNKAILLVLADSGLRSEELCHLLIAHRDAANRTLRVFGKGAKERVVPYGLTTARAIKHYMNLRTGYGSEDFLFVTDEGAPFKQRGVLQIIHRLCAAAGLPADRRTWTHGLRGFAATAWIRAGMGLDQVRRLLGHESLATTLIYLRLVASDLKEAHEKASAVDRLGLV